MISSNNIKLNISYTCIHNLHFSISSNRSSTGDSFWMIEASPDVVIPGHESVVILSRHTPRLISQGNGSRTSSDNDGTGYSSSKINYQQRSLISTLNVFSKDKHEDDRNILYTRTWKIYENEQVWWNEERKNSIYAENGNSKIKGIMGIFVFYGIDGVM